MANHPGRWFVLTVLATLVYALPVGARIITEILDASGDGIHGFVGPEEYAVTVDAAGNVFVAGALSNNLYRIDTSGVVTQLIDTTGDGAGNVLDRPGRVAVDSAGNAYVTGMQSYNAFRVTPGGIVTELIDNSTGLSLPRGVIADAAGNVFVSGTGSDNVFRIAPDTTITEILDQSGDGAGNEFHGPFGGMDVDGTGTLFVSGLQNVFSVTSGGTISEIIDQTGDGAGNLLEGAGGVALDSLGNVYVSGTWTDNVFRVTPLGAVTLVLDETGDGHGNVLDMPHALDVDADGNLFVVSANTSSVFRVRPSGSVLRVLDGRGDGGDAPLAFPLGIVTAPDGSVYVTGSASSNLLRLRIMCDDAPRAGCRTSTAPAKVRLVRKDNLDDARDLFVWKWKLGGATPLAAFGDPLTTTDFSLCLYDAASELMMEMTAPAGGTCDGIPCWTSKGSGFKYVDKTVSDPDGVRKLLLRAGDDGRALVAAKGGGRNLPDLKLPASFPLTLQLQASNGECWESAFDAAGVRRNDETKVVVFATP